MHSRTIIYIGMFFLLESEILDICKWPAKPKILLQKDRESARRSSWVVWSDRKLSPRRVLLLCDEIGVTCHSIS